jgi:hypothetical protein
MLYWARSHGLEKKQQCRLHNLQERDEYSRWCSVHLCKKYTACVEVRVGADIEMTAVGVKCGDPKCIWEIVGVYRAPNEDMRVTEQLAARTGYLGNSTKRSIIGRDLILPCADWKGNAEGTSRTQAFVNRLVWENGYTQAADSPARGKALLHVCLVRPESLFTSCSTVQGTSDPCGALLEAEWQDNCCEPPVERLVPVCHKTDVLGVQTLLWHKLAIWERNGRRVEEIRSNFKI